MERVIAMEQIGEDKIAINRDTFNAIMEMVLCLTADIIIPENVDREKSDLVKVLALWLATVARLSDMAMFDAESFSEMAESLDSRVRCEVVRTDISKSTKATDKRRYS